MNLKEFLTYIGNKLSTKDLFYQKAMDDQLARNIRRAPAKRWNETKLDRAVEKMWVELMKSVYDKFKSNINSKSSNPYQTWVTYIDENEAIENLDEMIVDLEFE